MPGRTAKQRDVIITELATLVDEARGSSALGKADAIIRKWIADVDLTDASEFRHMCIMADSGLLVSELLLAQPSASGATAFDRLAARPVPRTAVQQSLLAALRASRLALLRVGADLPDGDIAAQNCISGEAVRLAAGTLPPGLVGISVFGRVVSLGDGISVLAGVPVPLDEAALSVASGHAGARVASATAAARWAEAIYSHVVRHGTLDVPGVNRPQDMDSYQDGGDEAGVTDFGDAEQDELLILARAWSALAGGPPDEDLLQRSRQFCDPNAIASAMAAFIQLSGTVDDDLAAAFERLLLVQIETVQRREQLGSGTVTLDAVARHVADMAAELDRETEISTAFQRVRDRVAVRAAPGGLEDAELSRLLQRIRGLRAKTVDQGCTEEEALAAAEKAAALLDRYGLSLSDTEFRAQHCCGTAVQTERKRLTPMDSCVPDIAAFFDCRVWAERPHGGPVRYMFFGLRADVAAATYLYELVARAFETETNLFRAGAVYNGMAGERRQASTSFQTGLATGIRTKLNAIRKARAQHQSSGRDLVVAKAAIVDEEIAKLGLELRETSTGSPSKRVLKDAFVAGTQAAESFEWTAGIEQGP